MPAKKLTPAELRAKRAALRAEALQLKSQSRLEAHAVRKANSAYNKTIRLIEAVEAKVAKLAA